MMNYCRLGYFFPPAGPWLLWGPCGVLFQGTREEYSGLFGVGVENEWGRKNWEEYVADVKQVVQKTEGNKEISKYR
jgi:hypothetical protein